ncbi:MAG: tetratricopeptide repeat protein [Treponema sp.]|jgi:tetratricopeptide (TPR) repeat protein|nr:tetratricopeptide repeat protein [Treponema sp.]
MKIRKELVIGIVVLLILVSGGVALYSYLQYRTKNDLAVRIAELGNGGTPQTIEMLREAISLYEGEIEGFVKMSAQTGVYWKILATRLQDRGLHNEALDALERAISYAPEDVSLPYMTGISATMVAKSKLDFSETGDRERERYYALAEDAYLRSIAMNETYSKPHYALGVLYVFELGRPEDAIPQLERYQELTVNNVDGMFVLARAYYMTGQYEATIGQYDRILSITRDKDKRAEAEQNRQYVMDIYYGW